MQPRLARVALVAQQLDEHRLVAGPDLLEKQRVHDLRRANHVRQAPRRSLAGSAADISRDVGRREPRDLARLQIIDASGRGSSRQSTAAALPVADG